MAVTSGAKPKQFALTLSADDLQMLRDLAEGASGSAAETVRALIRTAYAKRFKTKIPGGTIVPTIRAIFDDIAGPIHYTGGNIASRTGLPLEFLTQVLQQLEKRGIVECEDHMRPLPDQRVEHESQNWTWRLKMPRERAFGAVTKAGFDPDLDLTPRSPDMMNAKRRVGDLRPDDAVAVSVPSLRESGVELRAVVERLGGASTGRVRVSVEFVSPKGSLDEREVDENDLLGGLVRQVAYELAKKVGP